MKESELMIGNLILGLPLEFDDSDNWDVCEVVVLDSVGETEYTIWVDSKSNSEYFTEFKPLPLTEEWLLKFGFEIKDTVNRGYLIPINYDFQKEYLYCSNDGIIALWSEKKQQDFGIMRGCKYVHQLQNLYFALTKEKLTIK